MPSFTPDRLAVASLPSGDVPTLAHFYRDVVGLPLLAGHGPAPAFDLGHGCRLVIVEGQPAPARTAGASSFPALAFAVNDLPAAIEHLKSHGVEFPWGAEAGPTASWAKFYDPAGNLIEIARFERSIPS